MNNRKLRHYAILIVAICVNASSAFAQPDPSQVFENRLSEYIRLIDRLRTETGEKSRDSLISTNRQLMTYLKRMTVHQPSTLRDDVRPVDFGTNQNSWFNILTSDDGKLRIYCWDTWTGTSPRHFDALLQYTGTGSSTRMKVLNDIIGGSESGDRAGTLYTDITMLHTNKGDVVYLLSDNKIYGPKAGNHTIHSVAIDNGTLNAFPIFKTNGKLQSILAVDHDIAPYGEWAEDDANIKFSDDKDIIYLPILKRDAQNTSRKDTMDKTPEIKPVEPVKKTNKDYLIYRFDGNHFVYDKEANRGSNY